VMVAPACMFAACPSHSLMSVNLSDYADHADGASQPCDVMDAPVFSPAH
jgi:hypothetical protein